jgi:hypothetical protein
MKNLKLIAVICAVALAFGYVNSDNILSAASYGSAMKVNVNQNDQPINDADLVGRKYKLFTNTTTASEVCSSACVLDGIFITSGAASNYLMLYDSTTLAGGDAVFERIAMPGANTNSIPLADLAPVSFDYGLTIDANAADGFSAVVVYHMK